MNTLIMLGNNCTAVMVHHKPTHSFQGNIIQYNTIQYHYVDEVVVTDYHTGIIFILVVKKYVHTVLCDRFNYCNCLSIGN